MYLSISAFCEDRSSSHPCARPSYFLLSLVYKTALQ